MDNYTVHASALLEVKKEYEDIEHFNEDT